jgi:MoxR-like ATPase
VPTPVRLKVLFAATNEIPEHAELAALKDRFCLKAACRSVQEDHFLELIDAGLETQTHRDLGRKPWAEGHATLLDFLLAHRYLTMLMARGDDRERYFRSELLGELRRVIRTLVREDEVFVSDRKVVKLYRLLRTRAWVLHGGAVEREDLSLLSYLGETREEIDLLEEKVPRLLGLS